MQPLVLIPDQVYGKVAASRSRKAYHHWASNLQFIEANVAKEEADDVGRGLASSASTHNVQAGPPFDEPGAKRARHGGGIDGGGIILE